MNPYIDQSNSNGNSQDASTSALVARIMRFYRIILLRKNIIFACIVLCAAAGAYRYSTQIPLYSSSAQLLILSKGGVEGNDVSGQSLLKHKMPTYVRVLSSDSVLKSAAKGIPAAHLVDFNASAPDSWYKVMRGKLNATVSPGANIINLRYTSKSPETAAFSINQIINAYLQFMSNTHQDGSKALLTQLKEDQKKLEDQYAASQKKLLELQKSSALIINSGDETTSVINQRVLALNESYMEANKTKLQLEALVKTLKMAISNGSNVQQYAEQVLGQVGNELLSQELGLNDRLIINRLQESLKADETEIRSKLIRLDVNHPEIQELANRIQTTQQSLRQRLQVNKSEFHAQHNKELAERLYRMAQQKLIKTNETVNALRASYEEEEGKAQEANTMMISINMEQKKLQRIDKQLDLLLEQSRDIDLDQRVDIQTQIVKEPSISHSPISPNKVRTAMFSLFIGLAMGIGIILVIEAVDDRFRSPDEIKYQLGIPVLAMVRKMAETGGQGIDSVQTFVNPSSVESEAFRTLRTALSFTTQESRRLLVTSTEKSDGKTTVMANLAVAFAQSDKKTLIVDTDMRRPGMSTLLELRKQEGLSRLLRSNEPVDQEAIDLILPTGAPNLDILPAGTRPTNPAELLSSDRLSDLFSWAETVYDQIIIDAPPILAVSDAGIVGRLADTLILVMRPDKNRRRMVFRSIETLQMFGIHMAGVVVNHLTQESGGEYYGYGYGAGYGYGEEYGHDDNDQTDNGYEDDGYDDAGYDSGYETEYDTDGYETASQRAA